MLHRPTPPLQVHSPLPPILRLSACPCAGPGATRASPARPSRESLSQARGAWLNEMCERYYAGHARAADAPWPSKAHGKLDVTLG